MTDRRAAAAAPLRIADAGRAIRHVFVRDLMLEAEIGVHRHEKGRVQPVRVNIDLTVQEAAAGHDDLIANVVCYEWAIEGVRAIVAHGHVHLAETLAERIADHCLSDPRVHAARVRIEKLAVFADVTSVGVEIERMRGG